MHIGGSCWLFTTCSYSTAYLKSIQICADHFSHVTLDVLTVLICMYSKDVIGLGIIQKVSHLLRSKGIRQKYEKVWHKRRGSKIKSDATPWLNIVSEIEL